MKIAIIGAGNVGAMTASRIIDANLADVVLVDVVPGLARGKALDISDSRPITRSNATIIGTEDYEVVKDSCIVIITAGYTRRPGMSRDDLLQKNSQVVKDICLRIRELCPLSIVLVVTNPLDVMSYLAMKVTGFKPQRVIGMAGVLDTARFVNILSEKTQIDMDEICMMGSHGDSMVVINRSKALSQRLFAESAERTRQRGAEIVSNLKTGSAFFSPSVALFYMLKSIVNNENKKMCASVYLNGQYGERDIYIGVPCIVGASGISEIIEIELTEDERKRFKQSAQNIRKNLEKLSV